MNDKTIIRPGGRRPRNRTPEQEPEINKPVSRNRSRTNLASIATEHKIQSGSGIGLFNKRQSKQETEQSELEDTNPIITLLSPIILLVSKVKVASTELNLDELRSKTVENVEYYRSIDFGMESNFRGKEEVSYGLCCFLDEMVLNTPWGAKSNWANESLLVTFHKEAWGGERFFDHLDRMSLNPSANLHAIEFYYALLELGFEGKYRQSNDGMRAHQTIKNNAYLLLEKFKTLEPVPLSYAWEGSGEQQNSLLKVIPQWVLWSLTLAIILATYFSFSILLSNQSDPVKRSLVSLRSKGEISVSPVSIGSVVTQPKIQSDLRDNNIAMYPLLIGAFSKEINEGLVVIEQQKKGISVRLTNAKLFRSGSNTLASGYVALVRKLGESLSNKRVRINITGHSDDIPIRTIKYPDNWALSEARAISVKSILENVINNKSQVFASGLANSINLVPNTTDANRALNRRVEILIRS